MQLQKFGIEIRKMGDVESLYREVDLVLSKFEIGTLVSQSVQMQTVAHSLQRMFCTERCFSVCTIRSCAELCQIVIPKERMAVYQSIHCMDWNEMLPDYRQIVVAMVLDDFRDVMGVGGNHLPCLPQQK